MSQRSSTRGEPGRPASDLQLHSQPERYGLAGSQELLWRACRGAAAADELDAVFRGGTGLAARDAIALYRDMYEYRQFAALRESFPRLAGVLGDRFKRVCLDYLAKYPSEHPALEWLGRELPRFLREHGPDPREALADLAALEFSRTRAFLLPDAAGAAAVGDIDPVRFADSVPRFVPTLALLRVQAGTLARWEQPEAHDPPPDGACVWVACWRDGFRVTHHSLPEDEGDALSTALAGASFAEICGVFQGRTVSSERSPRFDAGFHGVGWSGYRLRSSFRSEAMRLVSALGSVSCVSALLFIALGGCSSSSEDEETGESTGPLMRPGQNCLRCHQENETVDGDPPPWTAGGTVYASDDAADDEGVEGVKVTLTDIEGTVVELTTNSAGNFFTSTPLVSPWWVSLEYQGQTVDMPVPPPAGSCNACHSPNPVGGAPPRIVAPGAAPAPQGTCDGAGMMSYPSGSRYNCEPYQCDDDGCLRACASDADCFAGYRCDQSSCVAE